MVKHDGYASRCLLLTLSASAYESRSSPSRLSSVIDLGWLLPIFLSHRFIECTRGRVISSPAGWWFSGSNEAASRVVDEIECSRLLRLWSDCPSKLRMLPCLLLHIVCCCGCCCVCDGFSSAGSTFEFEFESRVLSIISSSIAGPLLSSCVRRARGSLSVAITLPRREAAGCRHFLSLSLAVRPPLLPSSAPESSSPDSSLPLAVPSASDF